MNTENAEPVETFEQEDVAEQADEPQVQQDAVAQSSKGRSGKNDRKHRVRQDLIFFLHDPFALTHFDLRHYDKPNGHLQDARTVEHILHRAKFASRSNDEAIREAGKLLLDTAGKICVRAQQIVQEQAAAIDDLYKSDTVVGDLPKLEAVQCELRWPEPKMWALVRALVAVDTANRQLNRLLARAAIDAATFKKLQFQLIRPLRAAFSAIYALAAKMPRQNKEGEAQDGQAKPVIQKKKRPTWTMASKDVVEKLHRLAAERQAKA
jgi:hypothetical protein